VISGGDDRGSDDRDGHRRGQAGTGQTGPRQTDPGQAGTGRADAGQIERRLRELGKAERAFSEKAYLKIDLEFAGVTVPRTRAAVKDWTREQNGSGAGLDRDRLTAVAAALWVSSLYESRLAAEILLENNARLLEPADIGLIERLLRNSGTWALVDGLAPNVAGDLAARYPADIGPVLDRWAQDQDFWLRRSALLAPLRPLRRGGGDFDRFAGYADAMLEEKEFFIRKAIGWVLRETAKKRPELVADWLAPRVHRASGVTVREAVKPLPAGTRELLLAGYRERRPVRWQSVVK
jgi:3-methyladenine DNA glycosylase AlkD